MGDGVNDAPDMAPASYGIAMGAAGSDAAIETAAIAMRTDRRPREAAVAGRSLAADLGIIRQNIGFALGLKALFVVLTFASYATL